MTCLEKLRELQPTWSDEEITKYTADYCPKHMYIAHAPIWCNSSVMWTRSTCENCWNRTLEEYEHCNDYEFTCKLDGEDMRCLDRLCESTPAKTRSEVIASALYFLEQSLLYDPCVDLEVKPDEAKG